MTPQDDLSPFSAEDLLTELRSRASKARFGAEVPGLESNEALSGFDTDVIARELYSKQEVIYGADDRQDIFTVADADIIADADSVVALFATADVVDNGNGTSTLQTQNYGVVRNLCAGEAFRDQPVGANCSGFLVAADMIATAGHCIDQGTLDDFRFVFGFRMIMPQQRRSRSTTAKSIVVLPLLVVN
jgi:Trypsin